MADQPKTPYAISVDLTEGPGANEVGTTYKVDRGAHRIRILHRVSPDAIIVYQSRLVGFHLKVQSGEKVDPTARPIKDLILKDVR